MPDLSQIPSIDQLLNMPVMQDLIREFGRPLSLEALRDVLDDIRQDMRQLESAIPDNQQILLQVKAMLNDWLSPTLVPAINAIGVILHTNLGRAPLSQATIRAMMAAVGGYSNLEFNLNSGKRGKRSVHVSKILSMLTKTEAGYVVNNNAGAVLLALSALAHRKKVLVSRTQLIEIGGGFRIPDVMRQSGAKLVEIGATNRLHLSDFEKSLAEGDIALVLVAHHSNFKLIGFHSEPDLKDIVAVAHQFNVPVAHDLGSGALLDTSAFGLAHEPTVQESVEAGCDLICFSGDKLVGGPQAGIIIGREALIKHIQAHPLARALRPDKLTLSGITATLTHYLKDEAVTHIPIWQMIARPLPAIRTAAENWCEYLGTGTVIEGFSTVGGGSLPTEEMPTHLLAINVPSADKLLRMLRECHPPIIARIEEGKVLFDPRTVLPEQEAAFLRNLLAALNETKK